MEPIKENPNEGQNLPSAENFDLGQEAPSQQPEIESQILPAVESAPMVEEYQQPAVSGEDLVVENGQVYQMPPHDDASDTVEAHVERLAPLPEEEKLWQLKILARDKTLAKAVDVVKKMNDPWLEDKFHDDLRDDPEWRSQLEALGKIEKL